MSRWTRRVWADPKGCGTPFRAPRARRERTKKSILEVDIRASGERRETIGVGGIDWKRDRIRGLGNEFDCGRRNVYRVPDTGEHDWDDGESGECDLHGRIVARLCRGDWSCARGSSQRAARVAEGIDASERDWRGDRSGTAIADAAVPIQTGGADSAGRGNNPVRVGPPGHAALGRSESGAISRRIMYPAIAAVATYNGYFGAGAGVLVMAAMGLCGISETWRANVFKTVVQATSNATAVGSAGGFRYRMGCGWRDVDWGGDRGLCGDADRRANAAQAAARDYNYWGSLADDSLHTRSVPEGVSRNLLFES
jgi:hypothetical protein